MSSPQPPSSRPTTFSLFTTLNSFITTISTTSFSPSLSLATLTTEATPQHTVTATTALLTAAVAASALKSVIIYAVHRRRLRNPKTGHEPVGPNPLPIVGNMLSLRRAYFQTLFDYVDAPLSVFWVMTTPFIVVNDEQAVRRVLGGANGLYAKPRYFGYKSRTVSVAVDAQRQAVAKESAVYDADGDASRVALQRMVRDALPTIKAMAHRLLRGLERENESDSDAIQLVRSAVTALNLRVLFGVQEEDGRVDACRLADMIGFAGEEFARRMVNPLRVWFNPWSNVRFARDVVGLIRTGRLLCRVLDESMHTSQSNSDDGEEVHSGVGWVHAWVGKVGVIGKLGKVLGLVMASTQTVPLTIVWLLHLVGRDAAVRSKLQEELAALGVHSVTDLTFEHLQEMKYADAVVRETLRLYPPFPLMQRQALAEDELCGIRIRRGMVVSVVPWLIHRNERYWRDAHSFLPGRFVEEGEGGGGISDWVYVPFGRGARMCAGSRLAMVELKVVLAHAVLGFEWSSCREGCGGDERFPELGMVPRGVRLKVTAGEKAEALDWML